MAGVIINRRNVILLLVCIELMLLAVNTNFVAFSHYYGENAGEEGEDDEEDGNDVFAILSEGYLGNLTRLAGDGGVVLAASERKLVQEHDRHAEDHHDDGKDARFARVLRVHRDVLGRKGA